MKQLSVVFGALLVALAAVLSKQLGHPIPPLLNNLVWVGLPLGGAAIVSGRGALDLLGLSRFNFRGVVVGVVGSLAMLAGLVLTADAGPSFDLRAVWRGAVRPALVEEMLFRGLAFGVLFWKAGWSFRTAMLVTGALFGAFHIPGAYLSGHLDQVWGAALLTGVGGCWFAWLHARWDRSLWVPIAVHMSMNLWWVLYSAGPTASGGGSGATWGRVAAITVITVATIRMTQQESTAE